MSILQQTMQNQDEFLGLFYAPEIDKHQVSKKTKLSLYVLRVDAGKFDYNSMHTQLGNASMYYVFSRSKIARMKPAEAHQYFKEVQKIFRNNEVNDGEGGELFLYCFLEAHLKAPKILSKMDLKTAGDDYIKGADGIHLLDLGGGKFQLIFGESKMIGNSKEKDSSMRKALYDAFESLKKFEDDGFERDVSLVDSNLMKEEYSASERDYLRKIILPSAGDVGISREKAFGIFIGFELDIDDWDILEMSSDEIEEKIKATVRKLTEERYKYIRDQITKHDLAGYHFYIYAVPFLKRGSTSIDKTRKEIIKNI